MPPRERQKLQPRGIEALLNTTQGRINREQNRWEGAGGQGSYPVFNQPNPDERRHVLDDLSPGWLQASAPRNNSGLMLAMANNPNVNQMKNNYLSDITNSPYFGIGGYDFAEDHAPEYLNYFQDIKDKDTMARDAGFYPSFNPSLIENNPSFGLDYMMNILGGKGRVGFRKNLDDENYNAYANWGIDW